MLEQILTDFCLKQKPDHFQLPVIKCFSGNEGSKSCADLIFKYIKNNANSNALLKVKHVVEDFAGYAPLDPSQLGEQQSLKPGE